jgi:predicted amidohydrolase
MALAQYSGPSLAEGSLAESKAATKTAEAAIALACKTHNIAAIFGIPLFYAPTEKATVSNGNSTPTLPAFCTSAKCWYNTALVIGPDGTPIYRHSARFVFDPNELAR